MRGQVFKNNRSHVAILNEVASKVVESCRNTHHEYVFTYRDKRKLVLDRVAKINNNRWQKERKRANLLQVTVHNLRHAFSQRLRGAGVSNRDRAVLVGRAVENMSEHYPTRTILRLIDMANLVTGTRDTPTLLRVIMDKPRTNKKDSRGMSS